MEPNLYFIILKRLSESGVLITSDISDLLFEYFNNKDFIDHYWNLKSEDIEKFLSQMENAGHIKYTSETISKKNIAQGEIKVVATITPEGLMFYNQKMQSDTILETSRWNKRNIIITALLALASLVVSITNAIKSYFDSDNKQRLEIPSSNTTELQKGLKKE